MGSDSGGAARRIFEEDRQTARRARPRPESPLSPHRLIGCAISNRATFVSRFSPKFLQLRNHFANIFAFYLCYFRKISVIIFASSPQRSGVQCFFLYIWCFQTRLKIFFRHFRTRNYINDDVIKIKRSVYEVSAVENFFPILKTTQCPFTPLQDSEFHTIFLRTLDVHPNHILQRRQRKFSI